MAKNIVQRLQAYNADRIPALLALKYKNMRANPFSFFRGTNHLFYEDWPANSVLNTAPLTWICGDLHFENFGTYKGGNRLVYFDVNDFDEGTLAPCTWDVARFLTSLFLTAPILKISGEDSISLCDRFLETYFATLAKGHIHSVERANATGPIKRLILSLKSRHRSDFLDERSRKTKGGRRFKIDNTRYQPVKDDERQLVTEMIQTLAEYEKNEKFYKIHDIAFRIAGTGSLGVRRYAALIEGRGSPDENFILDMKETLASSPQTYLSVAPQPKWANHAERVATIQKHFQGISPALLTTTQTGNTAYLIKELQPSRDRIVLADLAGKPHATQNLVTTMAEIVAWGELRSAGCGGSAIADELIDFGEKAALKTDLLNYAQHYAWQVQKDFEKFADIYKEGQENNHESQPTK
jgi:uncharacterized protein (DUF2252 family)